MRECFDPRYAEVGLGKPGFKLFDNRRMDGCPGLTARTGVRNQHRSSAPIAGAERHDENLRSNAIRHTVDALASRGDEGRDKLR